MLSKFASILFLALVVCALAEKQEKKAKEPSKKWFGFGNSGFGQPNQNGWGFGQGSSGFGGYGQGNNGFGQPNQNGWGFSQGNGFGAGRNSNHVRPGEQCTNSNSCPFGYECSMMCSLRMDVKSLGGSCFNGQCPGGFLCQGGTCTMNTANLSELGKCTVTGQCAQGYHCELNGYCYH